MDLRPKFLFSRVSAVVLGVLLFAGVLGAFAEVVAAPTCAAASSWDTRSENEFVDLINATRAEYGEDPLVIDLMLVDNARDWIAPMRSKGRVSHAPDLGAGIDAGLNWDLAGENVGVGHSTSDLYPAFVASPTHLNNIIDPAFDRVGVGVFVDGNRMWTVQRYLSTPPGGAPPVSPPPESTSLESQPTHPTAPPTTGIAPTSTSAKAVPPVSTVPAGTSTPSLHPSTTAAPETGTSATPPKPAC